MIRIVEASHNRLDYDVVHTMQTVLSASSEDTTHHILQPCAKYMENWFPPTQNARYYRELHKLWHVDPEGYYDDAFQDAREELNNLMKSNLVIGDQSFHDRVVAGVGDFALMFLSARMDDEDLPWDINEEDW